MKNKYFISAITLALLGISNNNNINSVNAVQIQAQTTAKLSTMAQVSTQAKAKVEAKAEAKSELKVEQKAQQKLESKSKVEVESKQKEKLKEQDFFMQPFEQILAQNYAIEQSIMQNQQVESNQQQNNDAQKGNTFPQPMQAQSINLQQNQQKQAGVFDSMKGKMNEIIAKTNEKDRQGVQGHFEVLKEKAQKKAGEVLNQTNSIINSPEINILGDMVGGDTRNGLKKVQSFINSTANNQIIVGNNHIALESQILTQKDSQNNLKAGQQQQIFNNQQQNQQVNNQYSLQNQGIQEQILTKGPPVIASIQAFDQYGNVIAWAQNQNFKQQMQTEFNFLQKQQRPFENNFQANPVQQIAPQQNHAFYDQRMIGLQNNQVQQMNLNEMRPMDQSQQVLVAQQHSKIQKEMLEQEKIRQAADQLFMSKFNRERQDSAQNQEKQIQQQAVPVQQNIQNNIQNQNQMNSTLQEAQKIKQVVQKQKQEEKIVFPQNQMQKISQVQINQEKQIVMNPQMNQQFHPQRQMINPQFQQRNMYPVFNQQSQMFQQMPAYQVPSIPRFSQFENQEQTQGSPMFSQYQNQANFQNDNHMRMMNQMGNTQASTTQYAQQMHPYVRQMPMQQLMQVQPPQILGQMQKSNNMPPPMQLMTQVPTQLPYDMQYVQSREDVNIGSVPQEVIDLEQNLAFQRRRGFRPLDSMNLQQKSQQFTQPLQMMNPYQFNQMQQQINPAMTPQQMMLCQTQQCQQYPQVLPQQRLP